MLTRQGMIDNLIHKFGFENPIVIIFAKMCEEYEDSRVNNFLIKIYYDSVINEEIEN